MAANAIIFALANPNAEVDAEIARRHAAIVATGRSDLPNQINNVLAFRGVFAGAFDAGAREMTESMKLAAATAISDVVSDALQPHSIVPTPFDSRVARPWPPRSPRRRWPMASRRHRERSGSRRGARRGLQRTRHGTVA